MNDAGPDEPDGAYVQSLARGLAVIRAFTAETPRMPLAEIARATGLTRATARRFLLTLERLGYVRLSGRDFSLTPRVLELGFGYLSALTIPELAQPHLETLSRETGESASLSVLDDGDIVYLARVPTRRIMSVSITIGTRFPASATSMGRVLLAALPAETRAAALAQGAPLSPTARTRTGADLERVAREGWCLTDQELEPGLRSLAAPVHRAGEVVAAINVAVAAGGETVDATRDRLLAPLLAARSAIDADLDRMPRH